MLRCHHIVVVVLRKTHVHSVAGFAGTSVADVIGEDDEVAAGIEQLTGSKHHIGKLRSQELLPGASAAVKDKHCVRYPPVASCAGVPSVL